MVMVEASMRGSGLPERDPTATCEACGATGTVGNATRFLEDEIVEIHRFCGRCWPEHYARFQARWDEEDRLEMEAWLRGQAGSPLPSRGYAFEAASFRCTVRCGRSGLCGPKQSG